MMEEILRNLTQYLKEDALSPDLKERIEKAPLHLNSAGFDPWGLDPDMIKMAAPIVHWFYREYFRVQTQGLENIPEGRVLLVANHGGQVPIDAIMISASVLIDAPRPRFARSMIDRWVPSLPFIGTFFSRCGQVVGDPQNCKDLLDQDECVLVFPEGTKGSGKTIFERYQLQKFGSGFIRLALETRTPILPVSVIGCEETYPSIMNLKPLARLLQAPYFPITPLFPLLGPLGLIPLPTKVSIRFASPMSFDTDSDAPEKEVQIIIEKIRDVLDQNIKEGLKKRGDDLFNGAGV